MNAGEIKTKGKFFLKIQVNQLGTEMAKGKNHNNLGGFFPQIKCF